MRPHGNSPPFVAASTLAIFDLIIWAPFVSSRELGPGHWSLRNESESTHLLTVSLPPHLRPSGRLVNSPNTESKYTPPFIA